MSLTISSGPLSGHPPETVNYRIDGPAHKLLMLQFPRRVRANFGGETVVGLSVLPSRRADDRGRPAR